MVKRIIIEEVGLENVLTKSFLPLSIGYKQRVSKAGVLVGDPEVIILDELNSLLDLKNKLQKIRTLIKELGKKHTVILSSHILSEVSQICERVVIINHGKIVAIDTLKNLEKIKQKRKHYFSNSRRSKREYEKSTRTSRTLVEVKFLKDNEDGTKQYAYQLFRRNRFKKKIIWSITKTRNYDIWIKEKVNLPLEDALPGINWYYQ